MILNHFHFLVLVLLGLVATGALPAFAQNCPSQIPNHSKFDTQPLATHLLSTDKNDLPLLLQDLKQFMIWSKEFSRGTIPRQENIELDGSWFNGAEFNHSSSKTISWTCCEGLEIFRRMAGKEKMLTLIKNYFPQIKRSYCGVASCVTVLRSLGISQYHQSTFFKKLGLQRDFIYPEGPGITLYLKLLRKIPQITVKTFFPEKNPQETKFKGPMLPLNQYREKIIQSLNKDNSQLIAYFNGETLGLPTKGHYSPILGYDQEEDLLLILDTARHISGPFFVKLSDFYESQKNYFYGIIQVDLRPLPLAKVTF